MRKILLPVLVLHSNPTKILFLLALILALNHQFYFFSTVLFDLHPQSYAPELTLTLMAPACGVSFCANQISAICSSFSAITGWKGFSLLNVDMKKNSSTRLIFIYTRQFGICRDFTAASSESAGILLRNKTCYLDFCKRFLTT